MSQIITITFSPCIDKSTSVPALVPEKKLKCAAPKLEPGGGGINVARAIKKLGGEATAIYPAGGYTGKYFNKLMADEAVPSIIIETESESRENIIVLEESTNRQYRFGMPGTELKETEWKQLLGTVEEIKNVGFIVASGSLPPGVPVDIFARIGATAKKRNIKFIVDTSGDALKYAAGEGVYLLKPNLGELGSLVGKTYLAPGEAALAAKQVIEKGNCEVVVVSMGDAGALLVTKEKLIKFSPPPVKRKSTVGAGDSMVAGIVLKLSKDMSLEESVQYGVACGTAATMNAGTELCRLQDVEKLYKAITIEKMNP
ncbi:MAG TPA: hexose kinase [Chitinophagaceae bacterium]